MGGMVVSSILPARLLADVPGEFHDLPISSAAFDAAAFYCPYIPLISTSVFDPTIESHVVFKPRYGMVAR